LIFEEYQLSHATTGFYAKRKPYRATRQTRKEAIRAAIALVGKGIEGVTITDEDGQIYQTANFTSFFNKGKSDY
jgi:hypothetical protein